MGDLEEMGEMECVPLMPRDVWPDPTAISACSIWTSLPEGLLRHGTEMGSEISEMGDWK